MTFKLEKPSMLVNEIRDTYEPSPNETLPYIGLEHINQNSLTINGIGKSSNTQSSKRKFKKGDILFGTLRPYFRKVVTLDFDGVCSTDIAVLRPKSKKDAYYAKYFIADPRFIDFANAISNGTRMPRANWKNLSKSDWLIPNENIRFKIGYVLDLYDKLISNNSDRIKILEEMVQLIYKESIENKDFAKKSILEIPYFNFLNQNIGTYEGYKSYFATADVQGTDFINDGIKYHFLNKPSRAKKQPIKNSVWFARMKDSYKIASFSKVNYLDAEKSILSSGFAGFSSNEKYFGFLYATISCKMFDKLKNLYGTGSTQISLNNKSLKRIHMPFPEEKIVLEFCNNINPIIDKTLLLKKVNKNLIYTRDYMLSKLMSGKVDVSDLDIDTSILDD